MRQHNHRKPRRGEPGPSMQGDVSSFLERGVRNAAPINMSVPDEAPERTLSDDDPGQVVEVNIVTGETTDLDGGVWEATLPAPTEADLASARAAAISVSPVDDKAIDRLWDWIRADDDHGLRFLGPPPETSKELHERVLGFGEAFYAIYEDPLAGGPPQHIGFVGLGFAPTDEFALVRLYLAVAVRGRLREIVPPLIALAAKAFPNVGKFAVHTEDAATARLYRLMGFKSQYVLTYDNPAAVTVTSQEPSDG